MTKIAGSVSRIRIQDPDPDPLVRGIVPRIRIRTKMSRIRNNWLEDLSLSVQCFRGEKRLFNSLSSTTAVIDYLRDELKIPLQTQLSPRGKNCEDAAKLLLHLTHWCAPSYQLFSPCFRPIRKLKKMLLKSAFQLAVCRQVFLVHFCVAFL